MQRALAPKRQVEEIDRFVREAGGTPKRAQLLELVARLNGAPNWNELQARKPSAQNAPAAPHVPQKAGERDVDVHTTQVVFIETTMFDDEEPWYLSVPVGRSQALFERGRELTHEELELLKRHGVVMEAEMTHPRVDRYGTPDEAITAGFMSWLHDEQGLSTCRAGRFELYSEDSGDDSPATCLLTIRLPKHLQAPQP